MIWECEVSERARKQLKKLGHAAQIEIISYLEKRLQGKENPRRFGKPLVGDLAGLWRYRVGSYRIICMIEDEKLIVLLVAVGDRKNIYR
jgi:mRNA interferase RelE/StbE